MNRRTLALALVLLFFLVACQGDDGGSQTAAATTTTVAPTTTKPDPAEAGCKQFGSDPFEAAELMLISRDSRIVDAVKEWKDANLEPEGAISGRAVRAVEEIVAACIAAGYEP